MDSSKVIIPLASVYDKVIVVIRGRLMPRLIEVYEGVRRSKARIVIAKIIIGCLVFYLLLKIHRLLKRNTTKPKQD